MLNNTERSFLVKFFKFIFQKIFHKRWEELDDEDIILNEKHCANLTCQKIIPSSESFCSDCRDAVKDLNTNGMLVCESCGTLVAIYKRNVRVVEGVEVPAELPTMKFVKGCMKCKYGLESKTIKIKEGK